MDWANRFTLGVFTVTYSTFRQGWEVIEKAEDEDRTEISHRWFKNRKTAEKWCLKRMSGGCQTVRTACYCVKKEQEEPFKEHMK